MSSDLAEILQDIEYCDTTPFLAPIYYGKVIKVYDGDTITVSGYSSDFKVNLYGLDKPKYIPYVF